MRRVLFVDDEPNILEGLKRMLRGLRKEWEMHFAESAAAGLEILEQQPFDIVISDMKMPGMDGAEFLTRVKQLYPDTVRIILSGHSDTAAVMKAVGPTHQYLNKPCEPDVLKAKIQKSCALRSLLESDDLKQLAAQLESIPSMPALYQEIVAELQNPKSSLEKIGGIIERDVGMSAKILKLVNSAYFGLLRPISSVPRSVAHLGLETVTGLVLGAKIFTEFEDTEVPGFSINALWQHSMDTAAVARVISRAEEVDKQVANDAFMGGMLHDVGTLVLAGNVPERFAEARRYAKDEGVSIEQAENEILQATHAEVGAYMMGLWGLPDSIIEGIAYHANPSASHEEAFGVVAIVHAADVLASEISAGNPEMALDLEYLERVGKAERVEAWREAGAALLQQEAAT